MRCEGVTAIVQPEVEQSRSLDRARERLAHLVRRKWKQWRVVGQRDRQRRQRSIGDVIQINDARLTVLGLGEGDEMALPIDRPSIEAEYFAQAHPSVECDQHKRLKQRRALAGNQQTCDLTQITVKHFMGNSLARTNLLSPSYPLRVLEVDPPVPVTAKYAAH